MPSREKLAEFDAWSQKHITGDEKGQAQIFLDRLFQSFGQPGCLDVGGTTEFRIRKSHEDGGGTAFADYVWKPIVLIEMKKRGVNLQKHYRHSFDYRTRLVPNRPRYGHVRHPQATLLARSIGQRPDSYQPRPTAWVHDTPSLQANGLPQPRPADDAHRRHRGPFCLPHP